MKLTNGIEITAIPSLAEVTPEAKERLRKWIDALRSGKYTQGTGGLCLNNGSFCCLGVACDIVKDELNASWVKGTAEGTYSFKGITPEGVEFLNYALLPFRVQNLYRLPRQAGFQVRAEGGEEKIGSRKYRLTSLNDDLGATFKDIANIIEIAVNGGLNPTEIIEQDL